MKNKKSLIVILMLILSLLPFVSNTNAITLHETSSGTAYGSIISNSHPTSGTFSAGDLWYLESSQTDATGLATNGTYIWSMDQTTNTVYKYDMDGNYINNWTINEVGFFKAYGITANETYLWITDYDAEVYKFDMNGNHIANYSLTGAPTYSFGITSDDTNIWVSCYYTDYIYKYDMNLNYINKFSTLGQSNLISEIARYQDFILAFSKSDAHIYIYELNGDYTGINWHQTYLAPGCRGIDALGNVYWMSDYSGDRVMNFSLSPYFEVNRTVSANSESNKLLSYTPSSSISGDVTLKIPVSSDVRGILDVTNNSGGGLATEVNTSDELVNDTFWYDSSNQFVHIRTINLTASSTVNWTVNCSYGVEFNLIIPPYLRVGQYFHASGFISDEDGDGISMVAETRLLYSNGTDALSVNPKHNCTNGNYECTFSTAFLSPGVYNVSIEFTDPDSGVKFKRGQTLYLSWSTIPGIYSDAILQVSWYNTNEGLGLPEETLQLYIDGERKISKTYYTYIGATLNVTVRDYYNITLYSNNFTIDDSYYFIDLGLTFHEYDFTNTNDEYYYASFKKQGADRWYEKVVAPDGQKNFLLPTGNYVIRVYNADNSTYVSWAQTIDRSRAYLISGYNITLVIEGQSVIRGQILELRDDLDYALTPDAILWSANPVVIFSCFDRIGQELGSEVWKICPALNVIATTINESYGTNITSYRKIPTNGTTNNGTVSIIDDTIYLSGNSSVQWVNITYADNGTLMQNTTYIPNKINLEGQNLTIIASDNISILRETIYSSMKKFYWNLYNSTNNPGYISRRAGYHSAGITVYNPFTTPIYDVYVFAGFSNLTTPDYNTVQVTDIENGVTLKKGENFKVTGDGIEFKIAGGIDASSSRAFTLEYYKDVAHTYYYEDAQIVVRTYDDKKTLGTYDDLFNRADFMWVNDKSMTFRGSLRVKFDFNIDVDSDSVRVFDRDSGLEIDEDNFIVGDEFVWIDNDAMGSVMPGGTRSFYVYFTELTYPGQAVDEYHLSTPFITISGIPISVFLIIVIIGFILMGVGIARIIKTGKLKDKYLLTTILGLAIIFIFWILQAKGV